MSKIRVKKAQRNKIVHPGRWPGSHPKSGTLHSRQSGFKPRPTRPKNLQINPKPVPWEQSANGLILYECVGSCFVLFSNTYPRCLCLHHPSTHPEDFFPFFLLSFDCWPYFLLQIRFLKYFCPISHSLLLPIFACISLSDLRLFLLHCLQPVILCCLFRICPYSFYALNFPLFSTIHDKRKELELSKVMFQNWRINGLETLKTIHLNLIMEKTL